MKSIKSADAQSERGSTLLVALSTVLILSLAGAAVLSNSTTRYNATSKQVKAWKEALYAAEAGGDLAFAEIRKYAVNPSAGLGFASADGWAFPAPSPFPATDSWNRGYTNAPPTLGDSNSLSAKVTVDKFALLPGSTIAGYYRIRSVGTAQVSGLKRTGMDNRIDPVTKGDSLLRKIDFNIDHFISTYGYGDALATAAATTANGKDNTAPVMAADKAQVSRRVELIAIPVMPIEGAVKTSGSFNGTLVDSFDSKNGDYKGSNPASPYDVDAHDGDVVCGGSTFSAGQIYGDVSTNGGNASTTNVSGVVDNNVPIVLPTATPGVAPIPALPPSVYVSGSPATISPAPTPYPAGHVDASGQSDYGKYPITFWYIYSNFDGVTVNPVKQTVNGTANTPIDTVVNVYVTGDVGNLTVNKGVTLNLYFRGNMDAKAKNIDNNNVDGPGGNGVYVPNWQWDTTQTPNKWIPHSTTPHTASPLVSRSGHLWFYGISPADGSARTIKIDPPGEMHAAFYAPSHDFGANGNPDIYGVMVCKSFTMNGNCTFHFDKQLLAGGNPLDYRIASYIEDIR